MSGKGNSKKWYLSKALVVSIVGLICTAIQLKYGFVIDPQYQLVLSLSLMGILRTVTNNRVVFFSEKKRNGNHGVSEPASVPGSTDQVQ